MKASTKNPALILFLVDGSHSTGASWVTDSTTGAEQSIASSIESGVNRALHDLVVNVCYDEGEIRNRIALSLLIAQGDTTRWGLEGERPSDGWLPSDEWSVMAPQPEDDGSLPKWLSLQPEGKTPIVDGWHCAFETVSDFLQQNPESSAMIITLTDGSFEELNLSADVVNDLLERQSALTESTNFLHLIGHISRGGSTPLVFPNQRPDGDVQAMLYDLATQLPSHLFSGQSQPVLNGVAIDKEAKAYVHNADHGLLSELIELGSRVVDGGPVPAPAELEEEE